MDVRNRGVSNQGAPAQLRAFFESPETPYAVALVRIVMPWTLLLAALPRWRFARELFSLDGAPTPLWVTYDQDHFLPILPAPLAVGLFTLLICCLVTLSLGWRTRLSAWTCALLYPYFGMVDSVSTMTKYVVIATHVLLLLALSNCGRVWSIDTWLERGDNATEGSPQRQFPCWPRRLIQLFLGVVYLGSAVTKLHTPQFFTGDHLTYWMLSDVNFPNPLGESLTLYPAAIIAGCYVSTLWEVLFLFTSWRGYGRVLTLSFGLMFHLASMLTLGLLVFPLLCPTLYLAFLTEKEAKVVGEWAGQCIRSVFAMIRPTGTTAIRLSERSSLALFATVILLASLVAVDVEAKMDLYGEHRAEGRFPLQPLAAERVHQLLRGDVQVLAKDKVFSLDVGTRQFGGVLADRKASFTPGEEVLVQVSFVPPHEDLWLEVHLRNDRGAVVARKGQICTRESLRSLFTFPVEHALPPGEYRFVLRINAQETASKRIRINR